MRVGIRLGFAKSMPRKGWTFYTSGNDFALLAAASSMLDNPSEIREMLANLQERTRRWNAALKASEDILQRVRRRQAAMKPDEAASPAWHLEKPCRCSATMWPIDRCACLMML